jgi:hypothetical protein
VTALWEYCVNETGIQNYTKKLSLHRRRSIWLTKRTNRVYKKTKTKLNDEKKGQIAKEERRKCAFIWKGRLWRKSILIERDLWGLIKHQPEELRIKTDKFYLVAKSSGLGAQLPILTIKKVTLSAEETIYGSFRESKKLDGVKLFVIWKIDSTHFKDKAHIKIS